MGTNKTWRSLKLFLAVLSVICVGIILLIGWGNWPAIFLSLICFASAVCLPGLFVGVNYFRLKKLQAVCTAHALGQYERENSVKAVAGVRTAVGATVSFMDRGRQIVAVTGDFADDDIQPDAAVSVWYNPVKPEQFFVGSRQTLDKSIHASAVIGVVSVLVVAAGIAVLLLW